MFIDQIYITQNIALFSLRVFLDMNVYSSIETY